MKKAIKFIDLHFEEALCLLGVLFFVAVSNIQVFTRLIPWIPVFPWTEELARYSFVWVMFLGVSWAVRTNVHLRVDLILQFLPKTVRKLFIVISDIFIIGFSIYLCPFAWFVVKGQLQSGTHLTATGLPKWVVSICFLVMLILTAIRGAERIYIDWNEKEETLSEEEQAVVEAELEAKKKNGNPGGEL
jgi:TRAP-type C4-dicarboxylate transport system permease small subunit